MRANARYVVVMCGSDIILHAVTVLLGSDRCLARLCKRGVRSLALCMFECVSRT